MEETAGNFGTKLYTSKYLFNTDVKKVLSVCVCVCVCVWVGGWVGVCVCVCRGTVLTAGGLSVVYITLQRKQPSLLTHS